MIIFLISQEYEKNDFVKRHSNPEKHKTKWSKIENINEIKPSLEFVDCLRRRLGTFGIPDECATDGGPEFTASATCQFLRDWEVLSVYLADLSRTSYLYFPAATYLTPPGVTL